MSVVCVDIEYYCLGGYEQKYRELEQAIRGRLRNVRIKGQPGRAYSFEVTVNGLLVYSMLDTGTFPDPRNIVMLVVDAAGPNLIARLTDLIVDTLQNIPAYIVDSVFIPGIILTITQTQLKHSGYVNLHEPFETYDYIVIGAGTAGSVLAGRLSENLSIRVLLLEAGTTENIVTDIPRLSQLGQLIPDMDWHFNSEPQQRSGRGLVNNSTPWPRGKCMGGTSVLNGMVYSRGSPRDYDDSWVKSNGARGWSWADLFPYFIKSENNQDPGLVASGYHGRGGPVTVSTPTYSEPVSIAFRDSGPSVGYPIGSSTTGPWQTVFELPQHTIRNGSRLSMAKDYLEPIAHSRPNLHILTNSLVSRILFDTDNDNNNKQQVSATGVEYIRWGNKFTVSLTPGAGGGEVILSAGAVMSPKVLMLSGIGHRDHLEKMGIKCLSDLPVGDNLAEHVANYMMFTVNQSSVTWDFLTESTPLEFLQYYIHKRNNLANSLVEAMAFVNTKYADKRNDWPDIQLQVSPATIASDYGLVGRHMLRVDDKLWQTVFKPYITRQTFFIIPTLLRPKSRGTIRLRSADYNDQPVIDPNFYAPDTNDLQVLVEGMKWSLKICRQSPELKRYGCRPIQTVFPQCQDQLPIYSDKYLQCMAQTFTGNIYHPVGTCKMAGGVSNKRSAVVDPELRVRGVRRLRVVDASVFPEPVSGNPVAAIVAVAERAADLIAGGGRRLLRPMRPPMSAAIIGRLPELPIQ